MSKSKKKGKIKPEFVMFILFLIVLIILLIYFIIFKINDNKELPHGEAIAISNCVTNF